MHSISSFAATGPRASRAQGLTPHPPRMFFAATGPRAKKAGSHAMQLHLCLHSYLCLPVYMNVSINSLATILLVCLARSRISIRVHPRQLPDPSHARHQRRMNHTLALARHEQSTTFPTRQ